MPKLERGDRVAPTGANLLHWGDIRGTVTHFDGDPCEDEDGVYQAGNPEREVWIAWDKPCKVGDQWMNIDDLRKL